MRLQLTMKLCRRIVAGHLSKSLCAAAFLSIAIVGLAGGCNNQRSTREATTSAANEVSQISPPQIGKQITIRGKFSLWGKIGPYVLLDNQQVVYLIHKESFTWGKPYSEMEGKLVTATGILRFHHAPDVGPTDGTRALSFDYFYFEVETAQLRLISH
jgi:hypothetical protein